MATVQELSDPYANFMVNPLSPDSNGVCSVCLTFTSGYTRCYRCGHDPQYAAAVLPISYSPHLGQLHTALAAYKRGDPSVARRFKLQLAAVLWRFLAQHESCLARRAGVNSFEVVTTVPSGSAERDALHPLREIVGTLVTPTQSRYELLLGRSRQDISAREVNPDKYDVTRQLQGASVLLVDDTWTTGASAQSAAGALRRAGAGGVGVVVIGRHIHPEYEDNEDRLRALPRRFEWATCAFE